MIAEDIVWREEYGIGVELIDEDHRQLFNVARRLFTLSRQPDKTQWVAEESIKFLKTYCVRHFEREEEYMRSINFQDLQKHMAQHAHMRESILPRIESQLRHNKFSPEAMEKFLKIINLWLGRHILEHDKAIGWKRVNVSEI